MTDGARFRVVAAHVAGAPARFFLLGELLAGELRPGMRLTAGPEHRPSFREGIDAVRSARERRTGRRLTALELRPRHPHELQRWREMDWTGTTLEIPALPLLHPCPCCGVRTRVDEAYGSYDVCGACGWEDDAAQHRDPDYRGGANPESLNEARAAFAAAHPPCSPGGDPRAPAGPHPEKLP